MTFRISSFKTVEAKVIIRTRYLSTNETMNVDKFQRSSSAEVTHIGLPSIYQNILLGNNLANLTQIPHEESLG